MVRRLRWLTVLMIVGTGPADADIFLISERFFDIELSVVYCNRTTSEAVLLDAGGGRFKDHEPRVPPGACGAFRLVTDRKNALVFAVAGAQIDVLQYEHKVEPWLSRAAWFGILFTLFGLFLGTLQELMKVALAQPAALVSLLLTYHAERRRFKLFVDDGEKRFVLSSNLTDIAEGKSALGIWLPHWLLKRVVRLVALKTTWQNELPLSPQLRATIINL